MKSRKKSLVNCVPLLVTTVLGRPNLVKMTRRASTVVSDVADFIGSASIHLVVASTETYIMCPSTGPAKSKCRRRHLLFETGHGTGVCRGGIGAASIQTVQAHTRRSISASTFGNQNKDLAVFFIAAMPEWFSCNTFKTGLIEAVGMTI